jgi:two-component system cell cycle response regulator CtrA
MLELLSLRKGMTLTKEMFLNNLYGGVDEPEQKIIDVFICKLRKKLANASGGKDYIETIWGRGYRLRELGEEEAAPIAAAVSSQGTFLANQGSPHTTCQAAKARFRNG